jgi:hypothetical protein
MFMISQMHCVITHIYMEGNQVADLLANHGLSISSFVFWNEPPLFISNCLDRNKYGIPSFRFCSS